MERTPEARVNEELTTLLRDLPIGSDIPPDALTETPPFLERFIPATVVDQHRGWKGESLDGVYIVECRKVSDDAVLIIGAGLLVSDQRMTPLCVKLEVSPGEEGFAGWVVLLGEEGEGPVGISGAPCRSKTAFLLKQHVASRVREGRVAWVYRAAGGLLVDDLGEIDHGL